MIPLASGSSSLSEAQLQALEGSYVFKASINDRSELESDPINLDLWTSCAFVTLVEANSVSTDNGLYNDDNITSVVRPKIDLASNLV